MALVTIPPMWVPRLPAFSGTVPAFATSLVIDASTERVAFVFDVPKAGTLDTIEFRTGTIALNAASVVRISLQSVSAGIPDGTQSQFRDISGAALSSNAWIVPGLLTSNGTDGGTKRTVARGDRLAVVFEYQTFTAADSVVIGSLALADGLQHSNRCYSALYTGTWSKQGGVMPAMALKYTDGTYGTLDAVHDMLPISALNSVTTFNSGTTPDERGMIFQFPVSVQISAVQARIELDAGADFVLYDADGTTALETVALDAADRQSFVGRPFASQLSDDHLLTALTNYRVTIRPSSVSNIAVYDFEVSAAALLAATVGGQLFHHTERADGGAWTQTTTKRPWMSILVTGVDVPVGGGGGSPLVGGRLCR